MNSQIPLWARIIGHLFYMPMYIWCVVLMSPLVLLHVGFWFHEKSGELLRKWQSWNVHTK